MTTTDTRAETGPYEVAPETFVVPWYLEAPPVGHFCMNSLVIRGQEPVLVDTGCPADRQRWLETVFGLVEPEDVRWVFLSHDDRDHAGNLLPVLEACPNATLLTTWFSVGRMAEEWMTPLPRCRFLNEGEQIDVGDRTLVAVRPPVFDNPTTRGLVDTSTGAFWAVDSFATPVPRPMATIEELDDDEFVEGQLFGARVIAPWHRWLDEERFAAHVAEVQRLPIATIASCHGPAIVGDRVGRAFELLRTVVTAEPWEPFGQDDLEHWLSAMPDPTPA